MKTFFLIMCVFNLFNAFVHGFHGDILWTIISGALALWMYYEYKKL